MTTSDERYFCVYHEKDGFVQLIAKDKTEARKKYYVIMASIMAHMFGEKSGADKKPFDKSRCLKIVRIEGPFDLIVGDQE
jgi:hypothetical protein